MRRKKFRNPVPTVDIIIEVKGRVFGSPLARGLKPRASTAAKTPGKPGASAAAMGGRRRRGIVLVERKNPPPGWALPGGFVDYGETLERAAVREAREETALDVELLGQFHVYSDPGRDPRLHTISTVFIARAKGSPKAGDDARAAFVFDPRDRTLPLAFDHRRILDDYLEFKKGRFPCPIPTKRKSRLTTRPTSPRSPESSARSKRT